MEHPRSIPSGQPLRQGHQARAVRQQKYNILSTAPSSAISAEKAVGAQCPQSVRPPRLWPLGEDAPGPHTGPALVTSISRWQPCTRGTRCLPHTLLGGMRRGIPKVLSDFLIFENTHREYCVSKGRYFPERVNSPILRKMRNGAKAPGSGSAR